MRLGELAQRVKQFLGVAHLQMVGDGQHPVRMAAVAGGASRRNGETLGKAR